MKTRVSSTGMVEKHKSYASNEFVAILGAHPGASSDRMKTRLTTNRPVLVRLGPGADEALAPDAGVADTNLSTWNCQAAEDVSCQAVAKLVNVLFFAPV